MATLGHAQRLSPPEGRHWPAGTDRELGPATALPTGRYPWRGPPFLVRAEHSAVARPEALGSAASTSTLTPREATAAVVDGPMQATIGGSRSPAPSAWSR